MMGAHMTCLFDYLPLSQMLDLTSEFTANIPFHLAIWKAVAPSFTMSLPEHQAAPHHCFCQLQ